MELKSANSILASSPQQINQALSFIALPSLLLASNFHAKFIGQKKVFIKTKIFKKLRNILNLYLIAKETIIYIKYYL